MSDYSLAAILAAVPGVLEDVMDTDEAPEIAVVCVLTETDGKGVGTMACTTGPEDAIRILREMIDRLEAGMKEETVQ